MTTFLLFIYLLDAQLPFFHLEILDPLLLLNIAEEEDFQMAYRLHREWSVI